MCFPLQIEPYAMLKYVNSSTPHNIMDVNGMYEGYIVDLMNELAQIVGFRYRLVPVWDGKFGYRKEDGSWDGVIGEIVRKVCILPVCYYPFIM